MQPSQEQQKIIDSNASSIKVIAFAGSGKTSTLVKRAQANRGDRILYLAYNKAIQLEAKAKFPSNVRCITSHALAFANIGAKFADAGKLTDKIRVNDAVKVLGLDKNKYPEEFKLYVADAAIKTLERYLTSERPDLDESFTYGLITPGSGLVGGDIAMLANVIWSKMCDLKDTSIGMLHDGYLKLYQMSEPTLHYDTIFFDEAQDSNPVTSAIVEAQDCQKVIVGDHHQQLYSFRGATNAMRKFNATETLYLTKSFRFGQPVADVANLLLSTFKGEIHKITGTDSPCRVGQIPMGRHAIIARSNATVFEEAARAIAMGKKIHFIGGIGGYRFGDALDAFNLWSGNKAQIQNPYLKSFGDFEKMEDYAGAVDDRELKSLIGLIKRHGAKLPRIVHQVRASDQPEAKNADITLTTAHKSKGLEFDNVKLADDYIDLLDDSGLARKLEPHEMEEINVCYVAATRAKHSLRPFADLQTLVSSQELKAREKSLPDWARPATITPVRIAATR